jgi:hypothetical protein
MSGSGCQAEPGANGNLFGAGKLDMVSDLRLAPSKHDDMRIRVWECLQ